jgi:hypothetical protein
MSLVQVKQDMAALWGLGLAINECFIKLVLAVTGNQ